MKKIILLLVNGLMIMFVFSGLSQCSCCGIGADNRCSGGAITIVPPSGCNTCSNIQIALRDSQGAYHNYPSSPGSFGHAVCYDEDIYTVIPTTLHCYTWSTNQYIANTDNPNMSVPAVSVNVVHSDLSSSVYATCTN